MGDSISCLLGSLWIIQKRKNFGIDIVPLKEKSSINFTALVAHRVARASFSRAHWFPY